MTLELKKAAKWNPYYSRNTSPPWKNRFDQVITELGFTRMSPGPDAFAEAVYNWQKVQSGLVADGVLGPKSWQKLEPCTRYSIDLSQTPPS